MPNLNDTHFHKLSQHLTWACCALFGLTLCLTNNAQASESIECLNDPLAPWQWYLGNTGQTNIHHGNAGPQSNCNYDSHYGSNGSSTTEQGTYAAGLAGHDVGWRSITAPETNTRTVVAIIGSGVDYQHPDLAGPDCTLDKVGVGHADCHGITALDASTEHALMLAKESSDWGMDHCNYTCMSDSDCPLDDFQSCDNRQCAWELPADSMLHIYWSKEPDSQPWDEGGRGTAYAGLITAEANNNEGVVGACPECEILSVKVDNCPWDSGFNGCLGLDGIASETATFIAAIDKVVAWKEAQSAPINMLLIFDSNAFGWPTIPPDDATGECIGGKRGFTTLDVDDSSCSTEVTRCMQAEVLDAFDTLTENNIKMILQTERQNKPSYLFPVAHPEVLLSISINNDSSLANSGSNSTLWTQPRCGADFAIPANDLLLLRATDRNPNQDVHYYPFENYDPDTPSDNPYSENGVAKCPSHLPEDSALDECNSDLKHNHNGQKYDGYEYATRIFFGNTDGDLHSHVRDNTYNPDGYSTIPDGDYYVQVGSDFGAALLAGVLAQAWRANPEMGIDEVVQMMKETGNSIEEYNQSLGYTTQHLGVRPNLAAALGGEMSCACGTIPGDATLDGAVNVSDIVATIEHILGGDEIAGDGFCNADYWVDDSVDVQDIVAMVALILGPSDDEVADENAGEGEGEGDDDDDESGDDDGSDGGDDPDEEAAGPTQCCKNGGQAVCESYCVVFCGDDPDCSDSSLSCCPGIYTNEADAYSSLSCANGEDDDLDGDLDCNDPDCFDSPYCSN